MSNGRRYDCLTIVLCDLRCEVDEHGPVDRHVREIWHDVLSHLSRAPYGRPCLTSWGSEATQPGLMALFVGHGGGGEYQVGGAMPDQDLECIITYLHPLEGCGKTELHYMTVVMGDNTPQSTNIATAVFDILDIFLLDYRLALSFGDCTGAAQEAQSLRLGEPEEAAGHCAADAFSWLHSGLQTYHHMRRAPSPRREIGQRWIGYTLDTYLAKQSKQTRTTETEVLIIGWRSPEQRQHFMSTPSSSGGTWETGFEEPLRRSRRLVSDERWSFTEHFYPGPPKPAHRSNIQWTGRWSRFWKRIALSRV